MFCGYTIYRKIPNVDHYVLNKQEANKQEASKQARTDGQILICHDYAVSLKDKKFIMVSVV